jgi:hypothetical protein
LSLFSPLIKRSDIVNRPEHRHLQQYLLYYKIINYKYYLVKLEEFLGKFLGS